MNMTNNVTLMLFCVLTIVVFRVYGFV